MGLFYLEEWFLSDTLDFSDCIQYSSFFYIYTDPLNYYEKHYTEYSYEGGCGKH